MDKLHILDEIRRTATANSGMPLGKDRFLQETGIREADWHGKFWARWGDAVREAGYVPNKLQVRYDDEALLERFARLIRDFGHFPVKGEILLAGKSDPSLPNDKTFRRLGTKHKLALRVVDYCQQHTGYDDVIMICQTLVQNEQPLPVTSETTSESESLGSVYLLKSGRYYKIGRSNAPGRRQRELAIQLPDRAEIVHTIATDDPSGIEAYWHSRFKDKRKNGEWFELTSRDVQAFRRRKFM